MSITLDADDSKLSYSNVEEKLLDSAFSIDDKEADLGALFLLEHPEYANYTESEAKLVLRKTDWILMPVMVIAILLAAADKILISNALLYGMRVDANLVGQQYSWLGSIFYFGYLVMELPAGFIIQKYPVGKCLSGSFIAWSIILMCMAAGKNFAGLAVMRFLLGMGETFLFPAATVITTMFYKKSEQPFRTAIWFNGFSSLITSILSYALGHAHSSIANWKILFLTFGAITFAFSFVMLYVIPDSPMTCKFFTEKEKYIAIDRTKENRTGVMNNVFKKDQCIEALCDWKTWVMAVFVLSISVPGSGLVTFAAQIVSGLGYSPLRTVLLGMPTGVFMTFSSWLIASPTLLDARRFRTLSIALVTLCPLICCVLMMKLDLSLRISKLMAYYFFYFYWGPYAAMTSLSMANTAGHSKKTTVNAINFISYCVANIIGPQFFITSEAPTYGTGYHAILGFLSAAVVSILIYGLGCIYENKKRDSKFGRPELAYKIEEDGLDMTDKQKESFRYTW